MARLRKDDDAQVLHIVFGSDECSCLADRDFRGAARGPAVRHRQSSFHGLVESASRVLAPRGARHARDHQGPKEARFRIDLDMRLAARGYIRTCHALEIMQRCPRDRRASRRSWQAPRRPGNYA